jgi:hypothetical protein
MIGGVAQLGERLPCTQEAIGSIPFTSTKFFWYGAGNELGRTQEKARTSIGSLTIWIWVKSIFKYVETYVSYFVAKLLRANGGCLGTKRR